MTRRDLLAAGSLASMSAATAPPNLDFGTALEAAEAIRMKRISSLELTQRIFDRIDRYEPKLNSFAYLLREEALAQARKADEAQAHGQPLGALHGVPVHVKESFAIAGHPCTWGIPAFRDSKAPRNSHAVERLLGAGAVLLGATNVPVNLGDYQSYNGIYGSSSNPWDLQRTSGGSSGGSAAALAAGLGFLSVGSDIGGSIRIPAHFCGIFGHKPTLDLVSTRGQLPRGVFENPGFSTLLAVGGPMARSADDLLASLNILGGPGEGDAKAWSWKMPAARGHSLKDFRVGYVLDDPLAPVSSDIKPLMEKAVQALERGGAKLHSGWPSGIDPKGMLDTYLFLLNAFLFSVLPPKQQDAERKAMGGRPGSLSGFAEWQRQNLQRLACRAQWQAYFENVDVFLSPVAFAPAFPHDHSEPAAKRKIATPEGPRPYFDMANWIAAPTLTGCPATSAPIGSTAAGLPVGIQIMGPYWEDATPIAFAGLLSRELGGFAAPPAYAA